MISSFISAKQEIDKLITDKKILKIFVLSGKNSYFKSGGKKLLSSILNHSVMSWGHTNMLGEYDFSDDKLKDSFNIRPPKLVLWKPEKMGV